MTVVVKLLRPTGAGRGQDEPSAGGGARRMERALAFKDAPPGAAGRLGGDRIPAAVRLVAGACIDEERFDPAIAVHVDETDLGIGRLPAPVHRALVRPEGKAGDAEQRDHLRRRERWLRGSRWP